MIRAYGFSFAELPFDEQGLLPRSVQLRLW